MFVDKARSLPFEWNAVRGSTQLDFDLACKYWTNVEAIDNDKRSSLFRQGNNSSRKKFYITDP